MTIKEVEQELNIPRASIRFYEKERLIDPQRSDNGYREYSEEDVATLRRVVIFRKLGLPVSDIEEVLDGSKPLAEALKDNIAKLEEQLAELTGAIELSKTICGRNENIESFDECYYWDEINREEEQGSRFMDIAKDIAHYQKSLFLEQFGIADREGNLSVSVGKGILSVLGVSLLWGGMRWLLVKRTPESFLIGVGTPFFTVVLLILVGCPIHLLGRKFRWIAKHEKLYTFLFAIVLCLLLILCVL